MLTKFCRVRLQTQHENLDTHIPWFVHKWKTNRITLYKETRERMGKEIQEGRIRSRKNKIVKRLLFTFYSVIHAKIFFSLLTIWQEVCSYKWSIPYILIFPPSTVYEQKKNVVWRLLTHSLEGPFCYMLKSHSLCNHCGTEIFWQQRFHDI